MHEEKPDPLDVPHVILSSDNQGFKCLHCGSVEAFKLPMNIEAFVNDSMDFVRRHTDCFPAETQTAEGIVYQVYFRNPEGYRPNESWRLWCFLNQKVGPVKVWGFISRQHALQNIACMGEEYDNTEVKIIPLHVTVTATRLDPETMTPDGSVKELQRLAKERKERDDG